MSTPLSPGSKQKVTRVLDTKWPAEHFPDLFPTHLDQAWGTDNEVVDHYVHPTASGARGVVFLFGFGGGTKGDHRQPAKSAAGLQNAIAYFLTASPVAPQNLYDVVSVNYERFRWDDPTPVTHIAAYSVKPTPSTFTPTLWPATGSRIAAFFAWASSVAASKNWDMSRAHVVGSSHGGALVGLRMLAGSLPVKSIIIESPLPDYRDFLISWPVAEGMFGDPDQTTWDARVSTDKNAVSQVLGYGGSPPTNYRPMYLVNAATGDHSTPYGAFPGGSIHDSAQFEAMAVALNGAGCDWDGEICPRGATQSPKLGVAIATRCVSWMISHE